MLEKIKTFSKRIIDFFSIEKRDGFLQGFIYAFSLNIITSVFFLMILASFFPFLLIILYVISGILMVILPISFLIYTIFKKRWAHAIGWVIGWILGILATFVIAVIWIVVSGGPLF